MRPIIVASAGYHTCCTRRWDCWLGIRINWPLCISHQLHTYRSRSSMKNPGRSKSVFQFTGGIFLWRGSIRTNESGLRLRLGPRRHNRFHRRFKIRRVASDQGQTVHFCCGSDKYISRFNGSPHGFTPGHEFAASIGYRQVHR